MNVMAFIPARGGSKGIPRKNLVRVAGRPLLEYTLEAARGSKRISDVFISTDNDDIAAFCLSRGFDVSYRRPRKLAGDSALLSDTLCDALEWLRRQGKPLPDAVVLLQPTSPLRTSRDIDSAIELFNVSKARTLISVHKMIEHPYECVRLKKNGWDFLVKHPLVPGRQQYKENFYFINGALYIVTTKFFMKHRTFIVKGKTALFIMPAWRGVDVDTPDDLLLAEFYLKKMTEVWEIRRNSSCC